MPYEILDGLGLSNAVRIDGRLFQYTPLNTKVLAVASAHEMENYAPLKGDWSAYIGAVDGNSHREEFREVARSGSKLPHVIANLLFPAIARNFQWRN